MLIAPQSRSNSSVYEAIIVDFDDYKGRGSNFIYLRLSPRLVNKSNLMAYAVQVTESKVTEY